METSGAAVFGEALLGFSGGVHSAAASAATHRRIAIWNRRAGEQKLCGHRDRVTAKSDITTIYSVCAQN